MNLLFVFISIFISVFIALPFDSARAQGAGSVGNGGNNYGAFLTEAAVKIYQLYDKRCNQLEHPQGLDRQLCDARGRWMEVLLRTKISTEHIVYGKSDLKPRDAVNGTLEGASNNGVQYFVTFSTRSFKKSSASDRLRILVHEFMTLAGFESSDSYAFSTLILLFIATDPDLSSALATVLSELPPIEKQERHFVGRDLSVLTATGIHPVFLRDADEYQRFCISKGYDSAKTLGTRDLPLHRWQSLAGPGTHDPVILDNLGQVSSVTQNLSRKSPVLYSVTCH